MVYSSVAELDSPPKRSENPGIVGLDLCEDIVKAEGTSRSR